MQSLRRRLAKHGLAAELMALFIAMLVLAGLLVDALYAGSDGGRAIRDIVAALLFGGLVTGTALAVGDPGARGSNTSRDE